MPRFSATSYLFVVLHGILLVLPPPSSLSPPHHFSHTALFSSPSPPFSPPFMSLFSPVSLAQRAEAHQGKQMLWLLFMFPLGLAFLQIIHRPCTVQTLGLNGLRWQLSQPYPHSDIQTVPQTLARGVVGERKRHTSRQGEPWQRTGGH